MKGFTEIGPYIVYPEKFQCILFYKWLIYSQVLTLIWLKIILEYITALNFTQPFDSHQTILGYNKMSFAK